MFTKKKIILNSAINDNKKGIVEILRLNSLTELKIKINSMQQKNNCEYIFLLKNNGIQQRFKIDNLKLFVKNVDIPIDLDKKISCLLIENGAQQTPIFWGGTDNTTNLQNMQKEIQNNLDNSKDCRNFDNNYTKDQNCTQCSDTKNLNSSRLDYENAMRQSLQNDKNIMENTKNNNSTQQDYYKNHLFCNNEYDKQSDTSINRATQSNCNNLDNTSKNIANHIDVNFQTSQTLDCKNQDYCKNHNDDIRQRQLQYESQEIEKEINQAMQYELIKNECKEYSFPQCANCKYKDIFYREEKMNEAKMQLEKIAQLQKNQSNDLDNEINTIDLPSITKQNAFIEPKTQMYKYNKKIVSKLSPHYITHARCTQQNSDNANATLDKDALDKKDNIIDNIDKAQPYYYGLIHKQYEEMFEKYPTFEKLSQIIDNSKWILVENIEEPYIMGIIYNELHIPQYLCYGILQEKKHTPPVEIIDSSQWVPFDINNEYGEGAYIMYQSAENGETLQIEVC